MDDPTAQTEVATENVKLKKVYFEFLHDFKDYLTEFVKESAIDLTISSFEVGNTPQKLFYGECGGMFITLKNQGSVSCFLTTDKKGAFSLDPGEKEKIWLNKEVTLVTISGMTTIGFIRS